VTRNAAPASHFAGTGGSRLSGRDPTGAALSFLLGNDPAAWRTSLPVWGRVRYEGLWEGVGLEVIAAGNGVRLRASADSGTQLPADAWRVEGALLRAPTGQLTTNTPAAARALVFELVWEAGTAGVAGVNAGDKIPKNAGLNFPTLAGWPSVRHNERAS
jgi:hypothetical protein